MDWGFEWRRDERTGRWNKDGRVMERRLVGMWRKKNRWRRA